MTKTNKQFHGDTLTNAAAYLAVGVSVSYGLTYNLAPQISGVLTLVLAVSVLVMAYVGILVRTSSFVPLVMLLLFMLISNALNLLAGNSPDGEALLRYVISLTALAAFTSLRTGDIRRSIAGGSLLLLGLAVYSAATGGSVAVAGTFRIAPFYGGEGAVHTSAITMVAMTIIFWTAPWRRSIRIGLVTLCLTLLVGYGAATELVMIAAFSWMWMVRHRERPIVWSVAGLIAILPFAIAYRDDNSVNTATIDELGLGAIGSGRVDAWIERMDIYSSSGIVSQLFGGGAYSDYRISPLWWWEPKSAHSDLITVLMEFGALGLVFFCFFIFKFSNALNTESRLVLISAILGMGLSNIILDRPGTAVFWGMAIYSANRYSLAGRIHSLNRSAQRNGSDLAANPGRYRNRKHSDFAFSR